MYGYSRFSFWLFNTLACMFSACIPKPRKNTFLYRSIFKEFKTMWEKQILVWNTDTQNENWGSLGHFLEIIKEKLLF